MPVGDIDKKQKDCDQRVRFRIVIRKLSVGVVSLVMFSGLVFSQGRTSFIIAKREIKDSFILCAVFDKNVTEHILESVNSKLIINNRLFLKQSTQEKTIVLNDKIKFHINIKPGELWIKFRKNDNNDGWYDILKSRCRDLEDEINVASGHMKAFSEVKEIVNGKNS